MNGVQAIEMSYNGLVQVEAFYHERDVGTWQSSPTSDVGLASFEFQATAQFTSTLSGAVKMVYERPRIEGPADSDFTEPEEAYLAWQRDSFSLMAGKLALPIGTFDTIFINETLLQGMVEEFDGGLSFSVNGEKAGATAYVFNGAVDVSDDGNRDGLTNYGARLWGKVNLAASSHQLTLDYISQGADSDGVEGAVTSPIVQKIPVAVAAYRFDLMNFSLVAEYGASLRKYNSAELSHKGQGARPQAWQVEVAQRMGDYFVGLQYQGTKEARDLELPECRYSFVAGKDFADSQSLKIELHKDYDYNVADDGTDLESFGGLVQWMVTF